MKRAALIGLSILLIAQLGCERKGREKASTGKEGQLTGTPTGTTETLAGTDRDFVDKAGSDGMLEVKLGQTATDKAVDPRVKAFGQRMVTDHSRANDELTQLAQRKGVTLSKELNPTHQQTVDRFSAMSGREFDKAYMDDMVKDHQKDIEEFRKQADQGQDPDVKSWAKSTLPTLEDHLKQAQETQRSLAGGGATTQPQESSATTQPTGESAGGTPGDSESGAGSTGGQQP
jgi:putative membrane protein